MSIHRYSNKIRFRMTRRTAERIIDALVTKTLKDHYKPVDSARRYRCWREDGKERDYCPHWETLQVARLIESGMKMSKTKARLDIPDPGFFDPNDVGIDDDADPRTMRRRIILLAADRFLEFASSQGHARKTFESYGNALRHYVNRSALERLAEQLSSE